VKLIARWMLLILGVLCLLPVIVGGGLWLIFEVWSLVERNNPHSQVNDLGVKFEFSWLRIATITALGVALLILGINLPTAKLRD
jgi:hypothetical protein